MLALAQYRDTLCPSCGLPMQECMSAANEEKYVAEPRRCHATTARLIAAERYKDAPQAPALLFGVRRR
jgi:hypothetical protein